MGWTESDIAKARAALRVSLRNDGMYRAAEQCKKVGPRPADPSLGLVANLVRQDPGIVERVIDEGFDARLNDVPLDRNPYMNDGTYNWWRTGWFAAHDNLGV